nr:unnamed protein product [Callosobruchus chinensis]
MARRGKLKYKDVVKGHQQRSKGNRKKPQSNSKKFVRNIIKKDKRKNNTRHFPEDIPSKKPKLEEQVVDDVSDISSEDEFTLGNLLNTFHNSENKNKQTAIDSSDSEEENADEIAEEHSDNIDGDEGTSSDESSVKSHDGQKPDNSEDPVQEHEHIDHEESNSNIDDEYPLGSHNVEDEMENTEDPFVKHLSYELNDDLLNSLQSTPVSVAMYAESWPQLGNISVQIRTLPKIVPKAAKPATLFIKSQIWKNMDKVNKNITGCEHFNSLQAELFSVINNYQDLYYPHRTFENAEAVRYVYCLHAVNHILKTRLKVIHHNARLSKKDDVPEEFRDQGLVRPKVLFIVPFKDAAYRIIRMLIDLILPEDKGNVMNKNRFMEEYTGNELYLPKKNPKPEDYEQTFQGNSNDDFKIGITVTKKSLKLYADFYSSDIIVASPLGLRTIIGAEGEPERDYDFLASIELLIFDQTEIFLMQNWDHVLHILNHIHLQPKDSHGTDFSRVRIWSLNGWSKYYRQTLIFSSLVLPEINAIFNKRCLNYAGKVKVNNPNELGSIGQVAVQLPHVFHRFDGQNAADAIDARFEFFLNKILPHHRESLLKQTLIFIPSYFDFVRIRNYFKREDIGFVQICEYSKEAKVARARDMFFHGDANFLLYTERYHFFNRKRIKGIRHLLFYQPPVFPHLYYEMCNLMQNRKIGSNSNMSVTVIYSKYDVHQLSAIVGTEKAAKMIQSERRVHMMVTGSD